MGIIYKVTAPNNKVYIGRTVQSLEKRKCDHISTANSLNNGRYNTKFSKAIRKYKNKLKWEVLCNNIPVDQLVDTEYKMVALYDAYRTGYNSTVGGDIPPMLGKHHSQVTKLKISERKKGCVSNRKGVYLSVVTKKKISDVQKGKKASEQTRHKMSLAHRGAQHHATCLTEKEVLHIRLLCDRGMTQACVARAWNLHKTTVSDIIRGKTWKHILPESKGDKDESESTCLH